MEICEALRRRRYGSWRELEREIEGLGTAVEKGNAFEQFCWFYLEYHKGLYQISQVYSNKIPGREIPRDVTAALRLNPAIDDGVDGVCALTGGGYAAYQAKFRSGRRPPTSNELNNFWSEAEYAERRMVIANSAALPRDVERRDRAVFVLGHLFDQLGEAFFSYLYDGALALHSRRTAEAGRRRFTPRAYQREMIDACVEGFRTCDRGKVIAACAAGKTLVSLWVTERMGCGTVVFFTPNLALVRQTIASWTEQCAEPFLYLAVCSDSTVAGDAFTIRAGELDIAVTTDPADIRRFLERETAERKVIFSTYQSVGPLSEAVRGLPGFRFGLGIYDEAHRTAGSFGLFQKSLMEGYIPAEKRLFMTATERLATPRLKRLFEEQNKVLFSMDDEAAYGKVFYRLPFGKAIADGIVADYRIVAAAMTSRALYRLVRGNAFVTVSGGGGEIAADIQARDLFKAAMFSKVMLSEGAAKAVSYHGSISGARRFAELVNRLPGLPEGRCIAHVNGRFSAAERAAVFREFEEAPFGLITNVRCLTEGVDIPYIDAILFADPRNSLIDIVQAVGRALRRPFGGEEKTAAIIVPILLDESRGGMDDDDAFAALHSVIQALRDQDETLAEWIDQINLAAVTGTGETSFDDGGRVSVILSEDVDYERFCAQLVLRISEANGRPAGAPGLGGTLAERDSSVVRVFKTLADYNAAALRDSLADPTIARFETGDARKTREEILLNNNNISHTLRLGLIRRAGGAYELTPLGRQYRAGEIDFTGLFTRQMLRYSVGRRDRRMYPYRAALETLCRVGTLNYFEFLYGLYAMDIRLPEEEAVRRAAERIEALRRACPNVTATSAGNREAVRETLNRLLGMDYSERDVWTDRTTTGNQYRFLLNHLSLLPECVRVNSREKRIEGTDREAVRALLDRTAREMERPGYEYGNRI